MKYMKNCGDKFFDLAIVDPPYRDENQPTKEMRKNGQMETLTGRPDVNYFQEICRISKEQIIWGANNFQLPQFKGFIVWDKEIPFDFTMSMAEVAAISDGLGTISKICKIRASGADHTRIHPTQKPIALYKWLLKNYAKPGQKIIDTHLGSGSSAIAAHYFGCDFVGLEIDEDYFNAAQKRFAHETRQIAMW
jgi:site-specific DNA-methyltransferase (adenine-specific)